ncbi:MAG TPA: septation protein A [Rhodocyclaceae bacterium]|nr:septation protein A [Rhodocyclaceae bacterium]
MKFLFDLFPVALFFAAFKISEAHAQTAANLVGQVLGVVGLGAGIAAKQGPILVATLVVILATALQIGWVRLRHGRVDKMLWLSLILVVFFGGLTLIFHDETFIKWKPTVLYWVFAAALLVSERLLNKNLIRNMLEAQMQLPEPVWRRLNLSWVGFFALMGALNLLIAFAFHLSTEVWVNFKLFGSMGLMLAFVVIQGMFLSKHLEEKP